MRPDSDIERAMSIHADTVWRVASVVLRNSHDVQDAFQDVFLKYALEQKEFESDEHVKAWLITVTRNRCLDMIKASGRSEASLEEAPLRLLASNDPLTQPGSFQSQVIDALQALSDPPRTPLYLSVVEGYSAQEIAEMVDAPVNTVYSWVSRGKEQLKEVLQ